VFLNNLRGHNSIVNTVSTNEDNVLFSGGDNGTITFWDYETGYPFQVRMHAATAYCIYHIRYTTSAVAAHCIYRARCTTSVQYIVCAAVLLYCSAQC
jgi:WD40 repeat protein